MDSGDILRHNECSIFNLLDEDNAVSRDIVSPDMIPEDVVKEVKESGLAGQWKGFVDRSIFEIDLPNSLGDAWGTNESLEKGTLKISYFHVNRTVYRKGLGTLLLKIFAATAKETLGYKRLIGSMASYEAVKTFLKVFGEDALTFTDDTGGRITGRRALEVRNSSVGKLDVEVDLTKFDSTDVPRAKMTDRDKVE